MGKVSCLKLLSAGLLFLCSALIAEVPNEAGDPVYSNDVFVNLVKKYTVSEGNAVDYAAWKESQEDLAALDRQVELLAKVSPHSHPEQFPGRSEQRSYWINTYNTLVLQAVLELWPMESVQDVKISFSSRAVPGKGFFYDRKVVVGGQKTNLYKLEKNALKQQKDPRLHFALNCASKSCPVLRPWEWTDEQLDTAAHDFINNSENVRVQGKVVYLSRIFKWYKKDFPRDLLEYLQGYSEPALAQDLQAAIEQKHRLSYRTYDWSLNAAVEEDVESDGG